MQVRLQKEQAVRKLLTVVVVCSFALVVGHLNNYCAQDRRAPYQTELSVQPPGEPNLPSVLVTPDEDYRIGPGDILSIQIEDAPELSGRFRVNASGALAMPYLGHITAKDKTTEELSSLLVEALRKGYLNEPRVNISIQQINSHLFFVQGSVRRPGVYQVEGRPSLLKLITVAGGLADNHGSSAFIIREVNSQKGESEPAVGAEPAVSAGANAEKEENAKYELTKVNISGLLKGRFDQNVSVDPGSIINIPPTDVFFVAGDVRYPGSFSLKDNTTLRQAISLASGTTFNAATDRGVIFREDPVSGKRQEIKVDIGQVMSGKRDDILIMPNDIIIVPNSRFKTISHSLLQAFGLSAVRIPGRF